ncbi:Peroxisomal N(1)-acetyl-spermine/spermidine oxidase [Frankliniella fusca]|uniref:Peroxisomal N(1)-acetyl-spermine/spermidine oxidase n=1 Tax=Frankliniella fusca TaxID=407009 RepID=A0AAE1HTD1_9NEOP|nr:Peroxisomal N(1)-acetyl-spermine/spermidine oxidase [Frankliniella fusca]
MMRKAGVRVSSLSRLFRTSACARRDGSLPAIPAGCGDCCPSSAGSASAGQDKEACLLDPCALEPGQPQPSVVIVGAGVAGLSAAERLAHCGLSNITVLEASDRPGGRVLSCWLGDTVVELGAQWLYGGSPSNSVYSLAAREGLLCRPETPGTAGAGVADHAGSLFCTSDGRAVDPALARAAQHTFSLIEAQARSLFSPNLTKRQGALLTFLHRRMQQEVLRYPEELRYDVAAVMHGLAQGLRCHVGADLANVSADHYGNAVRPAGADARVPMGFVGVLAPLLRELPECSVHYNKVVENIQWAPRVPGTATDGPPAKVRTADGSEYPADHVIVTLPLGVLKAAADTLFTPQLPAEKTEAIRGLGFGAITKIFLEYSRPFWLPGSGGGALQLAWSPDELQGRDGSGSDWTKGLGLVEEVPGSRAVLCAWVAGEEARCAEQEEDDAVAEAVTRTLRRFTGDPSLPYPDTLLRSRWTSDPFFGGAVSYLGIESSVGQQCDLSAPLPAVCAETPRPTLLFAGEATCPGHFATVHGARLSGLREAERVLAVARRQQQQLHGAAG